MTINFKFSASMAALAEASYANLTSSIPKNVKDALSPDYPLEAKSP
jgi:hypothetical protein